MQDRFALWFTSTDHRALQVVVDMLAWGLAVCLATLARWDFSLEPVYGRGLVLAATTAACVQVAAGYVTGLYRGRRRFGSFDEIAVLAPATVATSIVLMSAVVAAGEPRLVPLSVPLVGALIAFLLMGATRYAWRLRLDRLRRPTGGDVARVLVFGAGEGGTQVIAAM